jgi:hypothetical protein
MYELSQSFISLINCFCHRTLTLFRQILSDMDSLGLYATGDSPNECNIHVNKQI